jgi:predicted amidohydrolase YtcJ
VAIAGDHIAFVGQADGIRDWIGPRTRVIDAHGNSVLPGFIDSHVHFISGGSDLASVQLRDAATPEEFTRRIAEHAAKMPAGEWIMGGRWNHELWPGAPLPAKAWIDAVTPDNPVLVNRYDGHMCFANSVALKLAGITRDTESPPGGAIEKGRDGEPTGILKDEALTLAQKVIPAPSDAQLNRAIKVALSETRRYGVTGIHDNAGLREFGLYRRLHENGELTCRVYCMMPLRDLWRLRRNNEPPPHGDDWVRISAVKGFADGSLGSSTAFFFEPYVDNPQNTGLPGSQMLPGGSMLDSVLYAEKCRLQMCIHAIGDRANAMVLDMYEEAARTSERTSKQRRFRIEHAQHLRPADMARFASLGVIASMQPYHLVDDGSWAEKRIGRERCRTTYAFRSLLEHGVRLAFGSDWNVAPLNPMTGVHAAVTRQTSDGLNPQGWFPEQKLTLDEAIAAYTAGSAYTEFAEDRKGSLAAGKLADVVVLDADLRRIPEDSLKDVRVVCTVVGGRVVYET